MAEIPQQVALQEFFRWENRNRVEVVADITLNETAYFVPLKEIKAYFTANNDRNLINILCDVFQTPNLPIDTDLILRDHTAIFCILARIGQGNKIEEFAYREELSDRRLPFDATHAPIEFPLLDDDPEFLRRFCEKQWVYCVPVFDDHMLHKHFGSQRLLPVTYKEPYGVEGLARKYVIDIYGPHNKLIPGVKGVKKGTKAAKAPKGAGNLPLTNTFVLKTYATKEGYEQYKQETMGFRSLKMSDGIIRFFGSYIHGDSKNVLLEFADRGSLDEYFQTESPPSRGTDIIKFWEGLFQLIKALKAIHSVRDGHHDLNPGSVLVLSNGSNNPSDWQFKLADFGLNSSIAGSPSDRTSKAIDIRDAPTYGAPECYMPYKLDAQTGRNSLNNKITWEADIWSLGCIYSEVAVWIADGYKGLMEYRKQRRDETDRILFKGGDCFHNGERALKSVLGVHKDIEDRLRRSDYITKDILDSMVDEMLWEEDRPNAKALLRKADIILSRARQRLPPIDVLSRSSSGSRSLPPPFQPPSQPLPPIPSVQASGLSSISEQQYQPNVEKWRSQITLPQISTSQNGSPGSESDSPSAHKQHLSSTASMSDLDRELTGSIASWQVGDNNSTASPITPLTSPHVSAQFDLHRHNPNEGRQRLTQSPPPPVPKIESRHEYKFPSVSSAQGITYEMTDDASMASFHSSDRRSVLTRDSISSQQHMQQRNARARHQRQMQHQHRIHLPKRHKYVLPAQQEIVPFISQQGELEIEQTVPRHSQHSSQSSLKQSPHRAQQTEDWDTQQSPPQHAPQSSQSSQQPQLQTAELPSHLNTRDKSIPDDVRTIGRVISRTSSRQSSSTHSMYSPRTNSSDTTTPTKSSKRFAGFSLFPTRVLTSSASDELTPSIASSGQIRPIYETQDSGLSNDNGSSMEYLSMNTCLEWKKAQKKVKKKGVIPPLPGASALEPLNDRDHVFIIDDSKSMAPHWQDVLRIFEALSYVTKGMSPDGTAIFYTVAYDTYLRKDTSDLHTYLESKICAGVTNISYRLNLEFQGYRARILKAAKIPITKKAEKEKKKEKPVRPTSFYIITNGEWGEGSASVGTLMGNSAAIAAASDGVVNGTEELKASVKEMTDFMIENQLPQGQVTVEVVSFAQSSMQLARIEEVANWDFGLDIIDTTPWRGNILKMLRGPLDKSFFPGGDRSGSINVV